VANVRIESWTRGACIIGRRRRWRKIRESGFRGEFSATEISQWSRGPSGDLPHASSQGADELGVAPFGKLGGIFPANQSSAETTMIRLTDRLNKTMVHQPTVNLGALFPRANQEQRSVRKRQRDVLSHHISRVVHTARARLTSVA
jgi:hypothetical protein